jgi:hypothetical protein
MKKKYDLLVYLCILNQLIKIIILWIDFLMLLKEITKILIVIVF